MRFCLFGQGEGVHSDCEHPVWASLCNHVVTDASLSARKRGVRPGMTEAAAKALVSDLVVCEKNGGPTVVMRTVWDTLWSFTPWIQTVSDDSFWMQLPGDTPPLREAQAVMRSLDERIGPEHRFRVGMAENPFLSRALVAWSRLEKIEQATYRRVGRQQWILSPGLMPSAQPSVNRPAAWIRKMPIRALWMLPISSRETLLRLGIERLQDLESTSRSDMERHFGKESLLWLRFLDQTAGGQLQVNYPPLDCREVWSASIDDPVPVEALGDILNQMVQPISAVLQREGIGALQAGLTWVTDGGQGTFRRVSKRPLIQPMSLLAQLAPGLKECNGRWLERLEVFVEDLRPLTAVQTSFVIHKGMLLTSGSIERDELRKVLYQVNRKFPRVLTLGAKPRFRELRLQAIAEPIAWMSK